MGFANTVIGGAAALVRAAIKSPNYVAGSLGWSVNKDGSAEFNNLVVRGSFAGTEYVLNANGAFFYSPTEAAGNLAIAIAPVGTTGPFGETVTKGITVGLAAAASQIRLIPGLAGQASEVVFSDPTGSLSNNPNLAAGIGGASSQLLASGPALGTAGHKDWVQIMLSSSDGVNPAVASFIYVNNAGTGLVMATYNSGGWDFSSFVGMGNGAEVLGGLLVDTLTLTNPLTVSGSSTQAGLPNGGIQGTSGAASAGTAHTHGPGSFSVVNGQHTHGPGSYTAS